MDLAGGVNMPNIGTTADSAPIRIITELTSKLHPATVASAEWRQLPHLRADAPTLQGSFPAATALRIERRHVAVLVMDVAGYSRLIEANVIDTALRLRCVLGDLVKPTVLAHDGRVVDITGDGALMAFSDADDAVRCGAAVQRGLQGLERETPADRRIRLRMGLSAGEVLSIDGDLYGPAINIAARLSALAEAGSIYACGKVLERMSAATASCCEPLGRRRLRNISKPVRVFRVDHADLAI